MSSDPETRLTLYPLDGGAPRVLPGLPSPIHPSQWSADGKPILVYGRAENPFQVFRYDIGRQSSSRSSYPRTAYARYTYSNPWRPPKAAALIWFEEQPDGETFVCLDARLRDAAHREGFDVRP